MSALSPRWRERNGLRAVDLALADTLRRRDLADGVPVDEHVLLAAALASLAIAQGHAAFDPQRPELLLEDVAGLPDTEAWRAALHASRWVSLPASDAVADPSLPLAFDNGLLYLRRYREYERRLAAGVQRLAARPAAVVDVAALAPLFAALFPHARGNDAQDGDTGDDGGQARAAALALLQPLLLVTGGPGTGKTTTIARLLLLLIAQARSADAAPPRIALAAPTGRAAERIAHSLRKAGDRLRATPGVDNSLCDALPTGAQTLHRLLGTIPDTPRFRHDAAHPLPFDVIVVDEASMVDLPLMCKLVEAVAGGTRLVLLGDRDQLPSVEAGDVLAAMTDASDAPDTLPRATAIALTPLLGVVAGAASSPSPLAGHRVQLRRGYRQSEALDLAPLAAAMRAGDADTAIALLRGGALSGVHFHDGLRDPLTATTRSGLLDAWRAIAETSDPVHALRQAARLRLLTALREGPQGALGMNARIEEALAGPARAPYFHGRLLLIHQNDYRQQLFNGDIGVCLRGDDGVITVWFPDAVGDARGFHPSALPPHGGAFAMTVHKAQGSEFDSVWLLLPRQDARPLSRELLYTAITRARRELHVCADEAVLRAALARHVARVSGLQQRLR